MSLYTTLSKRCKDGKGTAGSLGVVSTKQVEYKQATEISMNIIQNWSTKQAAAPKIAGLPWKAMDQQNHITKANLQLRSKHCLQRDWMKEQPWNNINFRM